MLPIREIIKKTRIILKDEDEEQNSYKDAELLLYINSAIRFLRRSIKSINPMYLADIKKIFGLHIGEHEYEIIGGVSDVVSCTVNGKRIYEINPFDIRDTKAEGKTKYYYLSNSNGTINFYPITNEEIQVEVMATSLFKEIGIEDTSPFADDEFDDLVVEYVVIRAGISDQFNMSQEMTVMQSIYGQVSDLVTMKNVEYGHVKGY